MSNEISVVIPCYNAAAFLREAIDSALAQTRPPKEIIVADNASTDGSADIAASYGDRVTLLRSPLSCPKGGGGASSNRGAMASRGDFIAFLDADDIWLPQHLEKVAGLLDRWPEAGVAFSRYEYIGTRSGQWLKKAVVQWDQPKDVFAILMRSTLLLPSVCVVRRPVYAEMGGFDEGPPFLAYDLDFFARCAMQHKFMACPDVTVQYRWHAGQCSANTHGTLINAARYRARIIADLRALPAMQDRAEMITDRVRMSWEEEIENAWRKRELKGVRLMVRYGVRVPLYRKISLRYALKCGMPEWSLRLKDRMKGCKT